MAITKDKKYATILSDTEFIRCSLADGHFCALNIGLYHVDTNQWCMTAMFFKNNDKISTYCRVSIHNITGLQANYLDQGLWAISVVTPTPMEIKCEDQSHVKTLQHQLPSLTCNQCAVHFPLLSNSHLTLSGIQKASMLHCSLQTSISPNLQHLA